MEGESRKSVSFFLFTINMEVNSFIIYIFYDELNDKMMDLK